MTMLFRRCLTLFMSTLRYTTLIRRCKFQRWNTQRCFNVDLTLSHVATSHQPKDNVETTLKCFLGGNLPVAVAVQSFLQSDRLISPLRSKFYDQYSGNDNLPQGHLIVVSVPCDIRKDSFKDSFFEMNKFPMKEPINFCKFYDNEGTTHLLLWSDHFINPTVWYLFFDLNFMTSSLWW